jgi:hypothetical protein
VPTQCQESPRSIPVSHLSGVIGHDRSDSIREVGFIKSLSNWRSALFESNSGRKVFALILTFTQMPLILAELLRRLVVAALALAVEGEGGLEDGKDDEEDEERANGYGELDVRGQAGEEGHQHNGFENEDPRGY